MAAYSQSSRTYWLFMALSTQKDRIAILLRRLTGLGAVGGMNPVVFGKFLRLLDQIAVAREDEIRLQNRIEFIEQQHRARRRLNLLPKTESGQVKRNSQPAEDLHAECPAPPSGLLWLVAVWWLFFRTAINQKKQGLTVD